MQSVLAIRRETYGPWERRAPLSPSHVAKLVEDGIKVIVQPSNRRIFNDEEYVDNGAIIQDDLSEASLVLGVKQVPVDHLIPNKTYAFFSHTIKAQEENMPLLDAILKKNVRLIDYEMMVDNDGKKVKNSGRHAGMAGMVNILHGMGLRFLALGHDIPLMEIGPCHTYRTSEMAKEAVREAGLRIIENNLPASVGPLIFIFTGSGNVSKGSQEVFRELPHEFVDVEDLPWVAEHGAINKFYACVVSRKDHFVRRDGGKFDMEEADKHPELYTSSFSQKIAPFASCIVNGIYWDTNSPRLLSISDAEMLVNGTETDDWSTDCCPKLPHRLLAICDISADPGGSIEFIKTSTTIDSPFCLYDPFQRRERKSLGGKGILICSIANMPAQLPQEATEYFGSHLLPYIKDMIQASAKCSFSDLDCSLVVKNAIIASNGLLTPNYEYIHLLRKSLQQYGYV